MQTNNDWRDVTTQRRRVFSFRALSNLGLVLALFAPSSCKASQTSETAAVASVAALQAPIKQEKTQMWMTVGEQRFSITLDDNAAARAFAALLPLTLNMAELNGNEKHGKLPKASPTDESRPGMIHKGDLLLWGSHTLVVFYKTFSSPYSYTRLGRINNPEGLAKALGNGNVRIVFSKN